MPVRFAPSPTGSFHVGNLRTAWISRRWASFLKLPWVVRFEDIDVPRVVRGARERQLADMKSLGLVPDQIVLQSERRGRHWQVFQDFQKAGLIYPCYCSRKMVRQAVEDSASAPHQEPPAYSGRCRHMADQNFNTDFPSLAWRLKMPDESGAEDAVIARTSPVWEQVETPDAASFVPAYHWACAIDDQDGGYELLVRAWDLEGVTSLQRTIQSHLCRLEGKIFEPAAIFHCALVVRNDGQRLEKRTKGVTLPELLDAGEAAASLTAKFETSFSHAFQCLPPGLVFGEERKKMTLGELGLKE